MSTAGWIDVWHMALAVVARQPPFVEILIVTGAVFILVMALEGLRASLLAIWHLHRAADAAPSASLPHASLADEPAVLAMPDAAPLSKGFSPRLQSRRAASARRPKPPAAAPRQFQTPRPTIRRHGPLEWSETVSEPEPMELSDAL